MAVPKRKWSKRRSRTHRATLRHKPINLARCPQCHSLRVPHQVCKDCGYYDGREVVVKEED
ncbi:MAG: 50S ribosomal protein L32 [Clostridiaceae bacterium]|nr:50S ribosomal protein L32 [Clostridiaceae bacterium]